MKRFLLITAVVLISAAATFGQGARTAERIVTVPFSRLNEGNPPNGSARHLLNGTPGSTPCTAGPSEVFAIKLGGQWQCPKLTPGTGVGDVLGPPSSTTGELVRFANPTGKNLTGTSEFTGILFLTAGVPSVLSSSGTGNVVRSASATLTSPALITPTIEAFNNAQHAHDAAATGGQLNASTVFSTGVVPPSRIITGAITNSRCLRVSNVGQIEVAASDCGTGSGSSPGGVSGNLLFNEAGSSGGISNSAYNSVTGRLTLNQKVDGSDTFYSQRFTDTSPTGTFIKFRDATGATDLFRVGVDGSVLFSATLTAKLSSAPGTPSAGTSILWADSTDKNLKVKDDSGTISVTVRAITCTGTDKLSAISSAGVPTCSADQTSGGGSGITSLNTLTAGTQTFADVDDTNVTLAISSSTSTHQFTLGWAGTLAKSRQNVATVYNDQANTWSAGAQDFGSAASLKVPSAAGAGPTANGLLAYDTTSNTLEYGENGTNRTLVNTAGSQVLSNKTLDNSTIANLRDTLFTLQDNADATKTVNFELSGLSSSSNRTVSIANAASTTVQPTTLTANQFVTHVDSAGVVQKAQPSFSNLSGNVGPTQGGTGLTTVAQGDLLIGDATNSWARLTKSTSATRYLANTGSSNNPQWDLVNVSNGVTGTLPADNGGTGNAFFQVSGPSSSVKTFTFPNASASVLTDNAAVTIAQGGTGQSTQTAAFNALDPLNTKGDVLTHDGTNSVRLAAGSNGTCLKANSAMSTGLEWGACGAIGGSSGSTDNAILRADGTGGTTVQPSVVTIDDSGNVSTTGSISSGVGGSEAGVIDMSEGTAPSLVANTFSIYAPTDVAAGGLALVMPAAAFTGLPKWTNSSGVMTVTQATAGTDYSFPVASGTSSLGTSAIASGACATVVTTTATGTATTDVILWGFNGDPTGVTGYQPTSNGMLTIIAYPSANNVNYKVCNNTASSVTPGAITLNWRVVR